MSISSEKLFISAAVGAGFWAAGVLISRFAKPIGAFEGSALPWTYAAVAAAAIPTVAVLQVRAGECARTGLALPSRLP